MAEYSAGDSTLLNLWANAGSKPEPSETEVDDGWQVGEIPPSGTMNWIHNTQQGKINHSLLYGIPQWNSTNEYTTGSVVAYLGNYYTSLEDNNLNNIPTVASTQWDRIIFNDSEINQLNFYSSTFVSNNYTLTNTIGNLPDDYYDGMVVRFNPDTTNTSNVTVEINALGQIPVLLSGNALIGGELATDDLISMVYFSGNFYLLNSKNLIRINSTNTISAKDNNNSYQNIGFIGVMDNVSSGIALTNADSCKTKALNTTSGNFTISLPDQTTVDDNFTCYLYGFSGDNPITVDAFAGQTFRRGSGQYITRNFIVKDSLLTVKKSSTGQFCILGNVSETSNNEYHTTSFAINSYDNGKMFIVDSSVLETDINITLPDSSLPIEDFWKVDIFLLRNTGDVNILTQGSDTVNRYGTTTTSLTFLNADSSVFTVVKIPSTASYAIGGVSSNDSTISGTGNTDTPINTLQYSNLPTKYPKNLVSSVGNQFDLDTILKTGIYTFEGIEPLNSPEGGFGWLEVFNVNETIAAGGVKQVWTSRLNNNMFFRIRASGVWPAWMQLQTI